MDNYSSKSPMLYYITETAHLINTIPETLSHHNATAILLTRADSNLS